MILVGSFGSPFSYYCSSQIMLGRNTVLEIPFLSEEECTELIAYAHRKRDEIRATPELLEYGEYAFNVTESMATTAMYNAYSVLGDFPHLAQRLSDVLKEALPGMMRPFLVQSWVNIYDENDHIDWHCHSGLDLRSFTANIFLGGSTEPGLIIGNHGFPSQTIKNKVGTMLLMSVNMPHMTSPNRSGEPRYTVGMTIHDFLAITPDILSNVAINSRHGSIIVN